MNPRAWEAAGHTSHFMDPLVECKECHHRARADKLVDVAFGEDAAGDIPAQLRQLDEAIVEAKAQCPQCGSSNFTEAREFNLLFSTQYGFKNEAYLRPETAQGIFVNFSHVVSSTRRRLPLGIGQIGRSFRNEISPGNFLFRAREFTQMELEYFCEPQTSMEWYRFWVQHCIEWLHKYGLNPETVRTNEYDAADLAHYSCATTDIEFHYPFGWQELWGIAHRGDFDLEQHQKASGAKLEYRDPKGQQNNGKPFLPHVVEPSVGVDRLVLAFLCDAYHNESLAKPDVASKADSDPATEPQKTAKKKLDSRIVLKLHPELAPYRLAVLPLMGGRPALVEAAEQVMDALSAHCDSIDFDTTGSIGKRYRRQDEIGTPQCITVDHQTLEDGTLTVRDRDTMEQTRVSVQDIITTVDETSAQYNL
jgi:glycyl-tRNA synthetase